MEYVELRVELVKDPSRLNHALSHSQVLIDSLWKHTEGLAMQDRSSEVYSLYTTAINDIVDAYNERITMALVYRIPPAILWVLFIIGFLSMAILGYQFGLSGTGSLGINLFLALIFSVVMFLISALDRPETGLVPINSEPLRMLQQELEKKQLIVPGTIP